MSILNTLYDELTRKAQSGNKDITREIVEDWVENAGYKSQQIAFMSAALSDLEKGKYTPEEMVGDILQLAYPDN
jgi:hypothetical protein